MTDRHSGYVVVLDKDVREDDAEATIAAIKQIKGVLGVKPVLGGDVAELLAETRVNARWRERLIDLVRSDLDLP